MKTAKHFYTQLKAGRLARLKPQKVTEGELKDLKKILKKNSRILDLACGYGRITIPLKKDGYNVEGVDITPYLISKAKENARKNKVHINFKIGDMRNIPYEDETFDVILCIWSPFFELNNKKDQIKAIKEILRVLKKGGFLFADMPYNLKSYANKADMFIGKNLIKTKFFGIWSNISFIQTPKTLKNLMKQLKIRKFKIKIDKFGSRDRLVLIFWKN